MHSTTNTKTAIITDRTDVGTEARVAICACHLYDAECALHAAHQSGVDAWIEAAADKLHEAVVEHLAAVRAAAQVQVRS